MQGDTGYTLLIKLYITAYWTAQIVVYSPLLLSGHQSSLNIIKKQDREVYFSILLFRFTYIFILIIIKSSLTESFPAF